MMAYPKYMNPDDLYYGSKDHLPFIYTYDHQLFVGHHGTSHGDLVYDLNFDRKKYGSDRALIVHKNLIGRISNDYHKYGEIGSIISFWNTDADLYRKYLAPCLRAILNKNLIHDETMVSTPMQTASVEELLKKPEFKSVSDIRKREVEKAQQLHLMGIEKNQALKDRGIKPKTPIGATMGLQPGQKHWSMYGDHNLNFMEYYDGLS